MPHLAKSNLSQPFIKLLWIVLSVPALWLAWAILTQKIGYGRSLHLSGLWAIYIVAFILFISLPLIIAPRHKLTRALRKSRRALGVAAFGYSSLHLLIYMNKKQSLTTITSEALHWDMATGWIAYILFIPLAITSQNKYVRRMGPAWAKLHKLIYPATVLILIHWALTAFKAKPAYIFAATVSSIIILRFIAPMIKFTKVNKKSNNNSNN